LAEHVIDLSKRDIIQTYSIDI